MNEQQTRITPETPHRVLECFARDAGAPEWLLELYRERMGVAMTLHAVELARTWAETDETEGRYVVNAFPDYMQRGVVVCPAGHARYGGEWCGACSESHRKGPKPGEVARAVSADWREQGLATFAKRERSKAC